MSDDVGPEETIRVKAFVTKQINSTFGKHPLIPLYSRLHVLEEDLQSIRRDRREKVKEKKKRKDKEKERYSDDEAHFRDGVPVVAEEEDATTSLTKPCLVVS